MTIPVYGAVISFLSAPDHSQKGCDLKSVFMICAQADCQEESREITLRYQSDRLFVKDDEDQFNIKDRWLMADWAEVSDRTEEPNTGSTKSWAAESDAIPVRLGALD
jgi:hypothetical protein